MSEPVSSVGAVGGAVALWLASLLPYFSDGVVFAAFAGGAVFVVGVRDCSVVERVTYLVASVAGGTFGAHLTAGIIDVIVDALTQRDLTVPDTVGALAAGAFSVKLLQFVIQRAEAGALSVPLGMKK
ncbi:hypothetical protein HA052_22665 [Chromobacterium haemolyticum]|uniref:Phage holin n=1 Tax=Chromobacterium fluminis TaxID=3044269 RepID=A0ABX0LAP2_9NEIS|nr:putative holin [Chromobacterium haemolyticum]NHR07996.1 hypothetical protein [Chromobacterium haemolyticum]